MSEQEDFDDGCWAQAENEGRRRAEDEALERHRILLEQSKRGTTEFERDCEAFRKRILSTAQAVNERK